MATVLKVNYDGTLRRFTVPSRNSGSPGMSFLDLEVKIRELFSIPGGQLALTYKDKDGDVVTMASDDDLEDACVVQGLNPLYLAVKLVSTGSNGARAVASPLHMGGCLAEEATRIRKVVDDTLQNISPSPDAVKQLFTSVEPILRAAQGPVTSGFIDVMEHLVKSLKTLQVKAESFQHSTNDGGLHCATGAPSAVACPCPSPGMIPLVPTSQVSAQVQCPCPAPGLVPVVPVMGPVEGMSTSVQCPCPPQSLIPLEPVVPKKRCNMAFGKDWHSDDGHTHVPPHEHHPSNQVFHNGVQCDGCGISPIVGPRYKSLKKYDFDLCQSCFSEIGKECEYERYDRPIRHRSQLSSFVRQARYPAFQGSGLFSAPRPCHSGYHISRGPYGGKSFPRASGPGCSSFVGKLDARFVQDVSIFDGTEFAPSANFTKIWRLRNSGTASWPQHTQLVHVGGDELGAVSATSVELPENGLAPEAEVDASVDLVAPEKPGRYVSHWRLQAPTGQKFGHRVWVLIQVVPKDEESPQVAESLSQESEVLSVAVDTQPGHIVDEGGSASELEKQAPAIESEIDDLVTETEVLPTGALVNTEAATVEEVEVGDNAELEGFSMVEMPTGSTVSGSAPESPRSVLSEKSQKSTVSQAAPAPAPGYQVGEENDIEELLLKLDSMGFTQRILNAELLEKNEFDLERTVADLVSAADWDPILEELEEMGFFDVEMNRRLMFKNNGSVKRVVKELVQFYKAPSDGKLKAQ
eukprot:TRINITY_DN958_c0_g1_i1.p1 TRINITY_DN958_c0_g1~~TRINITY_DN958_c0_g1_i1.p1  ORF type:complete len:748 (+),score=143.90 TRINITY_DN958_c0_g1_i1:179-2422(+)